MLSVYVKCIDSICCFSQTVRFCLYGDRQEHTEARKCSRKQAVHCWGLQEHSKRVELEVSTHSRRAWGCDVIIRAHWDPKQKVFL